LRTIASTLPLVSRRKLRPLIWPVSRNVIIACAGLCGIALAPHSAFANTNSSLNIGAVVTPIDSDNETLIALNVGRFRVADDLTAASYNGSICVDIQQLFSALDFPILVDGGSGTASGWFVKEEQTLTLDLKSGEAVVAGKKVKLPSNSTGRLSTGYCMSLESLTTLLGLSFSYDEKGTLLSVSSREPLPIIARFERQGRSSIGSLRSSQKIIPALPSLPYRPFVAPNTDISISYSGQYAKKVPVKSALNWSTWSVGELAYMTAEAQFAGSEEGLNRDASRFRLYRSERDGGVFGISKLTEISFGDIGGNGSSLGANGNVGFGFSASTFPLARPTAFDKTSFEGALPEGWDVELYQNGQLLESRSEATSGGYSFRDVPVYFGENNFEIVQYGPQGQRRVITRRVNASNFLAPKGVSYYRAAIYNSELAFARRRPNSGLRIDLRTAVGVAENLNIGGGFDSYMTSRGRKSYASLSAQTSLGSMAMNAEFSASFDGKLASLVEFQTNIGGTGVRGRTLLAQEGYVSERVANNQLARFEIAADRGFQLSPKVGGTFTGRFQFDRFHSGETAFTARQRTTLAYGNAWLSQSLAWSHTSSGERRDVIDGEFTYSQRAGQYAIRTSAEYRLHPEPKLNRLSAIVERSFGFDKNAWRLRGEAKWDANENKFDYLMAASRIFRNFNFDFVAETNGKDNNRIGIGVSFALGRQGNAWGITSQSLAGSGTIQARVFEDNDYDGRFSEGDLPIENVGVSSQTSSRLSNTNADGYTVLAGVVPHERARVSVQTDELEDNNLFARDTFTKPREGTVSVISIPMIRVGSVEGSVELVGGFEGNANGIGGITLALLDSQQREIDRTVSAYDGYYAFEQVPAGSYSVVVAPDSSLATRLRPVVPVTITTTRAEPSTQVQMMTLIEKNPTSRFMALRGLL
jgi:SdrD B-like domain